MYAPGTGTPEVGGFSTIETQLMIRALSGLDLIGGDVVEVAPPFDPSGNTTLVGATMMFEVLCRTVSRWSYVHSRGRETVGATHASPLSGSSDAPDHIISLRYRHSGLPHPLGAAA